MNEYVVFWDHSARLASAPSARAAMEFVLSDERLYVKLGEEVKVRVGMVTYAQEFVVSTGLQLVDDGVVISTLGTYK